MNKIKVNRGAMRRARAERNGQLMSETRLPLTIGMAVRVISLSLSRAERSIWAGKHGVLANISSEHGMTMAHVRIQLSSGAMSTVRVPLAEIKSIEPGREFAPLDDNDKSEWNPMQSPFPQTRAPAQHAARIDSIINDRRA